MVGVYQRQESRSRTHGAAKPHSALPSEAMMICNDPAAVIARGGMPRCAFRVPGAARHGSGIAFEPWTMVFNKGPPPPWNDQRLSGETELWLIHVSRQPCTKTMQTPLFLSVAAAARPCSEMQV